MPMFEQASQLIINDSTFIENTNSAESTLQYLYKHVACGASYDSKDQYDNPKCHPDTRKQLLSDIHEWIQVSEKATGITFLHGPAGSGKSCIARSACEHAAKEGLLGASFFFWRNSSARNNESRFVTTLAYQLAETNSELKEHILCEVSKNPRIVDMPLEVQFRKLVLEPCSKVPYDKHSVRAIIIDGLDECMGEETQIGILQMLARAVRFEGFPLGFFITSRPELHIQEALDSKEVIFATNVISLNRIPGVSQDIRTVLESGFIRILNSPRFKRVMKSVARPWPEPENIDKLVQRSSGQFIYSSTVLKFVSDVNHNPATQLDIVLGVRDAEDSSPLANLDLLYHEIMSRVENPYMTLKVLSYVMAIKSLSRKKIMKDLTLSPAITKAVVHNQNRLLLIVEQLLGLSDGMAYFALNQLHSLVSLQVGSESTRRRLTIDFYHKSFQDFLTTEIRSSPMYVDIENAHHELSHSCMKFMCRPRYDTEAEHLGWLYSCFQWSVHKKYGLKYAVIRDLALRRFTSGLTDYLNVQNLIGASQVLGLVDSPWKELFNNVQKCGSFSLQDLTHAVNDARQSMGYRPESAKSVLVTHDSELQLFNERYGYPVLRKLLQSYYNDAQRTKLYLLVHHLTSGARSAISESETGDLLSTLGLVSDDSDRISTLSQYKDIIQRAGSLMNRSELEKFLMGTESAEQLHCSSEDVSDVYAAIISTGVWRHHMEGITCHWRHNTEITASSSLFSCLKSEALEFCDNDELNRRLESPTEGYLFSWLRKILRGPTGDVIKTWEQAFNKAHGLYPDNFKRSAFILSTKAIRNEKYEPRLG